MIPYSLLDPTYGLTYDDPTHRYTFDGEPMDSVTQIVGQFKKPFDAEGISLMMAERDTHNGREGSVDDYAAELRSQWDKKRNDACDQGDYVHAFAEHLMWMVNNGVATADFTRIPDRHVPKCQSVWSWLHHHGEIFQGFCYPEAKVVWPEYRIAGTVDLVVSNYEGVPSIVDWKQNAFIDVMGKYNNLLPPFQRGKLKLPDLNFWSYALQLNLYRRVLAARYGYSAERMVLVHIKEGGYQEFEIPFLDPHVDKILEMRA